MKLSKFIEIVKSREPSKKVCIGICMGLSYVGISAILENFNIIEEPAYWSLYGVIWGFALTVYIISVSD